MNKYTKAIAAFLTGVVTTLGGWITAIQTNAPEAQSTTVAVLGAVMTLATTLLVYLAPKNAPS